MLAQQLRNVLIVSLCLFFISSVQAVQRGRPVLNAERTTFVADNGQLLRGPFTSSEWGNPAPADQIANIKNLGFNAVHLYGECYDINYPDPGSTAPGYAASRIDSVVAATRDAGLYLVITIGNGANNGNYNLDYVVDFWDFYAPRYANETHVIYEVQNEPVAWGPPYSSPNATPPGAVNMEIAAYQTIRSHAPNTPVLLFSYAVPWGWSGANDALTDIHMFNTAVFGSSDVVWTNEAVAIHGYSGKDRTAEFAQAMIGFGYPCFQTEFAGEIWGEEWGNFELYTALRMEETNVSWLTFQFIPPSGVSDDVTIPKIFKDRVERSGMSWTPDYGTFPQIREPYGNGGQPRSTTGLSGTLRIQAEDFDTGGQDITYNDSTASNQGGQYRTGEDVDIVATSDSGGGYNINSTADGEWLEYTIFVTEPGLHNIRLRVASSVSDCAAKVIAYNLDKTGTWTIPNTGGAQTWTTITKQIYLEYGRQKLRIEMPVGGFNLNWIELSPSSTGPFSNGTYKLVNQNSGLVVDNTGLVIEDERFTEQNAYTGATTQQWNLEHQGAGQYRIRAANDNWQWSTSILVPLGNGFYRITNEGSGLDYEIENASLAGGATIVSGEYDGSPNQKWAVLAPSAPAFPGGLQADWNASDQVELTWTASTGATTYNVKRSVVSGGPYTTLATSVTGISYTDTEATVGLAYYYVVSANTASGESNNSAEVSPLKKLTGTIIGTSGSWNNDPTRTKEAAMDGNMSTFYDADSGSGDWVGLDLGGSAAYVVTEIRYVPRSGSAGRMVGGKFQGATTADFSSGVTDLFTVSGEPSSGVYTVQPIQDLTPYRYVRYLSAPNGYCNVAEIEFYSAGIPGNFVPAPTGLVAHEIASGQINLTWKASLNATSYTVKRSTTSGGPYTTLADDIIATSYGDTNTAPGETYYYVVNANTADDYSADSDEATTVEPHAHLAFDEAAGTTAADATGNGWNGTLVNGPTWTAGNFNNAVNLDGTDDLVTLPTGVVDGLTDVTISTWVYLNSASQWSRIFDFGNDTSVYMFLTPNNGSGVASFAITTSGSGNEDIISSFEPLPTSVWTHVAVTIGGGTGVLYVNGIEVGRNSSMMLTPDSLGATTNNMIGFSQYSEWDPHLNGRVDEFRIWPAVLSGDQIEILLDESIPDQIPLTPANLMTDTVSISEIDLSWDASAEATNYNIKRSTNAGGPYTIIAGTGGTSYSDTELDEGTAYYYVVSAVNGAGESSDSLENEGMTLAIPPSAPTGLAAAAGDHTVALTWDANIEGDLDGYNVYRSATQGGGYVLLNGSLLISPEYTDNTANNFTRYFYVVTAVDTDALESGYSNEVEAMPDDGTLVQLSGTDFESGLGDWVNISGDDTHDWTLDRLGTLTPNTGPSSGAGGSTWYLYLETSPGGASTPGDTAILESPVIGGFGRILTFDYHMYGLDIGTLSVDVYDGSWHYNIWSISGQQQTGSADEYIRATVDLADYTGPIQIRLRATSAGGPGGDTAIDTIDVTGRIFYGDMDGDGVVNGNDLPEFIANWMQVNCDLDLDGDCVITLYEFAEFSRYWLDSSN